MVSLASVERVAGSWDIDRSLGSTGFGLASAGDGGLVVAAYVGKCDYGPDSRDTEYDLGQRFTVLRTGLVVDQRSGSESDFAVRFYLDESEVPVAQYQLDLFTDPITGIEVDVSGARRRRVEVDAVYCKRGDHAILFQDAELVPG